MLETLNIHNIVLIDQLEVNLTKGLCVLTGETGSGKSILLDALGLAIGYRSNSRLLRSGMDSGFVVANFNIFYNDLCKNLLNEIGISFENNIIIRRVLYNDGRSKAFINDVPVTQSFLENVGSTLVEIHGQNDQIGLLNSNIHRDILDEFGGLLNKRNEISKIFEEMKNVKMQLENLQKEKDNIEKEQDYIQHVIKEIDSLNVKNNEEEELADKRILMMNKEKVLNLLNSTKDTLEGSFNVGKNLSSAQHLILREIGLGDNLLENGKNAFEGIIENLEQSSIFLNESLNQIDEVFSNLGFDGDTLERVEERLFTIRGLARKLNISSNILLEFREELDKKLLLLTNQEIIIGDLAEKVSKLKSDFLIKARELSQLRKITAGKLGHELMLELAPLKMEKTIFDTDFKELDENNWNKYGIDSLKFIASTNPGMPMNELSKIASGGELSRFMLALKVVLSQVKSVPTIIFDEIDAGISGAVAEAVGERLKKLGNQLQVLVVTHHSQVAAKGNYHLKVSKIQKDDTTNTSVISLKDFDRVTEIARMFSGEIITDEALKVAEKMINLH